MNTSRKPGERPLKLAGIGIGVVAAFALGAQGVFADPMALHVSFGDLYEFDVATGEYSLATTFDPPIQCHELTRGGDSLFCSYPTEFEGTFVRRLEPSTASVGWQVSFSELSFPDGIAYTDSLVYVVTHVNQPRRYFLLTLDPATGEELARVEISELAGPAEVVYALAARGSELWLMITGTSEGMAARRLDPLTGLLLESFVVPGIQVGSDADFGPGGRLFLSKWEWNPINTAWCTDYWIVPFLGGTPDHQFSHCWFADSGEPPPPTLAYFTLAERDTQPVVEIPTLSTVATGVFAALLALLGALVLRRASWGVSSR